jgi:hypothetical protein
MPEATYKMLEAKPSILSFPAGDGLKCPVCGSTEVTGTVDHITGIGLLDPDAVEGRFYYAGETDVDWNSQQTVMSVNDDALVQCDGDHWYFAVGAPFDGEGIGGEGDEESEVVET